MKKSALFLNTFLITSLFLAVAAKGVMAAPHLSMSPSAGNYAIGDEFNVTVKVNSGTETAGGVDGLITYDSAKLELVSAVKATTMVLAGDSGGDCSIVKDTVGEINFSCYSNDALSDKVLNGELIVMNFKAKTNGTATANFTCAANSTTDTNIVKTSNSSDLVVCSENVPGSYIISGTASTTTTNPIPTTAASTTTTTATTLPQTGGIASTVGLIVFGAISLASALFLKFL